MGLESLSLSRGKSQGMEGDIQREAGTYREGVFSHRWALSCAKGMQPMSYEAHF